MLEIIPEVITVSKVFVVPPTWPSKVIFAEVTSPCILKVVGKRRLVAVVALPIMLPSSAPTIVSATSVLVLTVFHRRVRLPLSYLSVSLGSIEVIIV